MSKAEVKAPKRGVGTVIREAILAGKDNEQALAAAKAEFPESKTTVATVSWYRNQLRKSNGDVKSSRELAPKKEKAPKAPKKAKSEDAGPVETAEGAAAADPLA